MKVAVLDDYQHAAADSPTGESLDAEVTFFGRPPGASHDEVVAALAGYDVVVAMRERTPFPAELLARLTDLRLLVTTGQRNAAIDLKAAAAHDITVCATGYISSPTLEHTWAMILAAARHLPTEFAARRSWRLAADRWGEPGRPDAGSGRAGPARFGGRHRRAGLRHGGASPGART